jgi:hypothetical protein
MSLSVGRAKMVGSLKDLMLRWEKTKMQWDDPMSQNIEESVLTPLEPKVRSAVVAMEKMAEVLARVKRDCQ